MDKLLSGLAVSVVGMVIVFVGLAILIVCINLLRGISGEKRKVSEKTETMPLVDSTQEEMPMPVVFGAAASTINQQEHDQLVAVITAAIAALWEGETGFVVRRVRRIQDSPAWQKAGREEQIFSRF